MEALQLRYGRVDAVIYDERNSLHLADGSARDTMFFAYSLDLLLVLGCGTNNNSGLRFTKKKGIGSHLVLESDHGAASTQDTAFRQGNG
jgi:hypothetical protein